MNKKYKVLVAFVISAMLMLMIIIPTMATENKAKVKEGDEKASSKEEKGQITSKEEVVYGKLDPDGKARGIYVINILEVIEPGQIIDYGQYNTIKNLTNLRDIKYREKSILAYADKGKFYYQGNLENKELPWEININYQLDGQEKEGQELVGESGKLNIDLKTRKNENINENFYKNYMLQISVTLDTEKCENIQAEEGVFANSGRDKIITFTVMPDTKGDMNINADVTDFSMEGISISAIPFSMNVDLPDMSALENDLTTLSEAIKSLSEGADELNKGMELLALGTKSLKKGSSEYKAGIEMLDEQSAVLMGASSQIKEALDTISNMLGSDLDFDFSALEGIMELLSALPDFTDSMEEIIKGLDDALLGFKAANIEIDKAIRAIPNSISEEEIQELLNENPENETINQLVQSYRAAQFAKDTYLSVKDDFEMVSPILESVKKSFVVLDDMLDKIPNQANDPLAGLDIAQSITELSSGLNLLASNYSEFHKGLGAYTNGVSELAKGYGDLNSGVSSLARGTNDAADGAGKLAYGLNELNKQTKDMPNQMKSQIEEFMGIYDTSDFSPISFVSDKNQNVRAVQFVLTTDPLEKEKPVPTSEVVEEKSFWDKLKDLF